ncbi:Enzyme that catalyzes the fourth step in the histidine pathway [Desmophyllum pertusum]|uniref:1-(5-phosphoribosyl)-5-[(5-phosphoribosylamino)methylideneamino]imidazole-4-carboxamideisomerase n=1 Tax=Desmophyllum pertusum TaxID=174260 RepID=A0A9X0CJX8_9CNID|nr:Enzyme that catalyzes the fourth step in the histidine pathway [Desmophyllum pertusum]
MEELNSQIVGGSLTENEGNLQTNFIASHNAGFYASRYCEDNLTGGHVIKLGAGNDAAAEEALAAWPGGLQIGGGITIDNAKTWLDKGAAKVIVTSWLFPSGKFSLERLQQLSDLVGKEQLVVDLSCRRQKHSWFVAINKWQTVTSLEISKECLEELSQFASEFLIHAADVEGLCKGIDEDLVKVLGQWSPIPCTYAGGGKDITDLELVNRLSNGNVDLTFGSALDLFGGKGVKYTDCVEWNRTHPR